MVIYLNLSRRSRCDTVIFNRKKGDEHVEIEVLDLFNLLSVPDGVSFSNPSKKIVAQVVKALSIKFEDYLGVSSQDKADKSEL